MPWRCVRPPGGPASRSSTAVGDPPGDPRYELVHSFGRSPFPGQLEHLVDRYRVVPPSRLVEAVFERLAGERIERMRPSAGAQWPRSFARAGKPHRALSARWVDRLSAAGFELGFHTHRHALPSTLGDDALSAMTAGAICSRRPSGARSR
jgi:hypothetical protein